MPSASLQKCMDLGWATVFVAAQICVHIVVSQNHLSRQAARMCSGKPVTDRGIETLFADKVKLSTQSFLC